MLVHYRHRRLLTATQAGRGDDTHIGVAQQGGQARQQILGSRHFAAQAVAHANGQARGLGIALEHLKVVVESGHLKHLGHRDIHLFGQRHQMAVMQATVGVVNLVQVLNQQVAAVPFGGAAAKEGTHFGQGSIVRLAAFELAFAANTLAHVVHGAQRHGLDVN